jgi:hypothetical protein
VKLHGKVLIFSNAISRLKSAFEETVRKAGRAGLLLLKGKRYFSAGQLC